MKEDDFEERLRRQPLRPIPPEWRAEILEAARAVASPNRQPAPAPWWLEWLWPCPQAWAGLAAVWMLILTLQFQTPSPPESLTETRADNSPSRIMAIDERRRELIEVLDQLSQTPATVPSKPPELRPRGQVWSKTALA